MTITSKPMPRRRLRNLIERFFTCQDCDSSLHVVTEGYGIVCITIAHSPTCPAHWLLQNRKARNRIP